MKCKPSSSGSELRWAKRAWPQQISTTLRYRLRQLVSRYRLSVVEGDLTIINGTWYVTHSGLLRVAKRSHCRGIRTQAISEFCEKTTNRWAFRATVFTSATCRGFVGYGDADPSNVSPLVRGAEMRIAETRAVNRALRKAYGIGICSVEEIGSLETQKTSEARFVSFRQSRPTATTVTREMETAPAFAIASAR